MISCLERLVYRHRSPAHQEAVCTQVHRDMLMLVGLSHYTASWVPPVIWWPVFGLDHPHFPLWSEPFSTLTWALIGLIELSLDFQANRYLFEGNKHFGLDVNHSVNTLTINPFTLALLFTFTFIFLLTHCLSLGGYIILECLVYPDY